MHAYTLYLTSTVDGVSDQRLSQAVLPPGKTRYPLYRRLGGPQGLSGRMKKISPSPHPDSIPGPSGPQRVEIPTELFRSVKFMHAIYICISIILLNA